jgi:Phytanoyl-CoA dioxygenase (PhyH)
MSTSSLALPKLRARGHELDLSPERFGFLSSSMDALEDPVELRRRLDEDGYLYMPGFFDRDLVKAARESLTSRLAAQGLLDPSRDSWDGVAHPDPARRVAFKPDLAENNETIDRVVFGPELFGFYEKFFGEPVRAFDFKWLRAISPGMGTPAHCDWVYMGRGTPRLLTCWIPYGDVPLEVGGLMMLEKSHHQSARIKNYLEMDVDGYCENRPKDVEKVAVKGGWKYNGNLSDRSDTLPEKFNTRWLTAEEWRMGDFITFNMTMIHGSLDNATDRIRLSSDTRYQCASEPADERWVGPKPIGHSLAGKRGRVC